MKNSQTNVATNKPTGFLKNRAILPQILTAIVLFLFGFFIGYFAKVKNPTKITSVRYPQSQNKQPATTSSSSIPHPTIDYSGLITPTPPPPKTINSIPGWMTYTNVIHKYTVQYPPDWEIDSSQADKEENYRDTLCCNTALLTISKGETKWLFYINQLYTGFDAPDECQPSPDKCENIRKNITVLGYPLYRIITRQNSSGKVVEAYFATPKENDSSRPGFGQIGIIDQNANPTNIKYFINYEGPEIEKYLTTLDQISENLQAIE